MMDVDSAPDDSPSLNMALLDRLRDSAGQFVSLSELGPDRGRVWEDLESLGAFGYQIEHHPYLGAAYRGPAPRLCPDQIEYRLGTRRIGRRIAVWNRVGSTNDLAARAAATTANDGLVVLAEEQTAGRGQRGRHWTVPPRSSILMSVLLFPPPELAPLGPDAPAGCAWLTALAAVATAELVSSRTGREARIKWPNDVRVDGLKVAGILVERAIAPLCRVRSGADRGACLPGVVIGIGLNADIDLEAFPRELRSKATSLKVLSGGAAIDRSALARDLIRGLDAWYDLGLSGGPATLSAPWRDRSEHLGREVRVVTPEARLSGRVVDLDLRDGMVLELTGRGDHGGDLGASHAAPGPPPRLRRLLLGSILSLESDGGDFGPACEPSGHARGEFVETGE
jgi:BirA family biotin operon repressor/biotin-[acetyl-CoA-carboxylase] ligase